MRVLQIIDSLRPGGAERMAVNYANALASRIEGSFLCCTRMEGLLKKELSPEVGYLFLQKKQTLDPLAFWKLRTYVKKNKINLIQAHSSSYFLAVLVKLSLTGVKLVWHDHYGEDLAKRRPGLLKPASKCFDGVISVNSQLKEWTERHLAATKTIFLNNFLAPERPSESQVRLKGTAAFKIICIANFRPQKDHLNLLMAFQQVLLEKRDLSLHLVGKHENDAYSEKIIGFIKTHKLEENVYIYGEQSAPEALIRQADLGMLSSSSEGLPLALLEYARAGIPIVCTAVGEVPRVVGEDGTLVPPGNFIPLGDAISRHFENEMIGKKKADGLREKVEAEFSEAGVMPRVLAFYNEIFS